MFDTELHGTIAAPCALAVTQAPIGFIVVAVIALFTWTDDAITTDSACTFIGALIFVDSVSVITLFIGTDDAVTADRVAAGVGARVRVDLIAVIALFAGIGDPVTTALIGAVGPALSARLIAVRAAIIALFIA